MRPTGIAKQATAPVLIQHRSTRLPHPFHNMLTSCLSTIPASLGKKSLVLQEHFSSLNSTFDDIFS